jgi:tetratricopeptide (TPR) repeat protein
MAGVYTDNQPDFSFLHPYETRRFRQAWYPIQAIGPAVNANRDIAVSLTVAGNCARIGVCVNRANSQVTITLSAGPKFRVDREATLSPGKPFLEGVDIPSEVAETDLLLVVRDAHRELIRYKRERHDKTVPDPATEPKLPGDIASCDELYVVGLHLQQYRHATRTPEPYWEEALRRDQGDARCNNALGLLRLRRGDFPGAEEYFRRAVARLTERNPNPYDGEPFYNLGLTLKFMGRLQDAYAAFAKATWNYAWQSAAHYALAQIHCIWREYDSALDHLDRSLDTNSRHSNGRTLKGAVLRRLSRFDEAERTASEAAAMDPLDFWSRNEAVLTQLSRGQSEAAIKARQELASLMRGAVQTHLDLAYDYAAAGFVEEASGVLESVVSAESNHPMVLYSLGAFALELGTRDGANALFRRAAAASPDYCFPARLEEMLVLEGALKANPADARAHYYLGNLLYDKQRYDLAIEHWELSCELDPSFSIPFRNLGIAYYNIHHNANRAHDVYEKAFAANPDDARLLYELDQLQKRMNVRTADRLDRLLRYPELVARRDDLTIELVTLYNLTGQSETALDVLLKRRFHPWEGGEGLVSAQYMWAHTLLGQAALASGNFEQSVHHFQAAQQYPHSLGEGKHLLTPQNHLHYFVGLGRKGVGDHQGARAEFELATQAQPLFSAMTYYRALAYRELGDEKKCRYLLEHLTSVADEQDHTQVKIDYFATSLPNFLLFEDDLQKRNHIECLYLKGLAERGRGLDEQAERSFCEVVGFEVSHLGAEFELRQLRSMPARVRP